MKLFDVGLGLELELELELVDSCGFVWTGF